MKRVKDYFLQKAKNKEIQKLDRKVEIMNFEKANTIAVMYDASDENDHNKVSLFVRHLQSMGKNVKDLGYINYKKITHYCNAKLSLLL